MDTRHNNSYYHVVRINRTRLNHKCTGTKHQHNTRAGVPSNTVVRPVPERQQRSRRLLRHILALVIKHERSLCLAITGAIVGLTAATAHASPAGAAAPTNSQYLMNDICSIAGPAAEWSILGGSLLIGSWYVWNMARRAARP